MSIVVGYVPRREGLAALEAAVAEALRRNEPLVVVNAGADADPFGSGPNPGDFHDRQPVAWGASVGPT